MVYFNAWWRNSSFLIYIHNGVCSLMREIRGAILYVINLS